MDRHSHLEGDSQNSRHRNENAHAKKGRKRNLTDIDDIETNIDENNQIGRHEYMTSPLRQGFDDGTSGGEHYDHFNNNNNNKRQRFALSSSHITKDTYHHEWVNGIPPAYIEGGMVYNSSELTSDKMLAGDNNNSGQSHDDCSDNLALLPPTPDTLVNSSLVSLPPPLPLPQLAGQMSNADSNTLTSSPYKQPSVMPVSLGPEGIMTPAGSVYSNSNASSGIYKAATPPYTTAPETTYYSEINRLLEQFHKDRISRGFHA